MTKQLVLNYPPVVCRILVLLESFQLGGVYKGTTLSFVAFSVHPIGNNDVFEPALLSNVVVL